MNRQTIAIVTMSKYFCIFRIELQFQTRDHRIRGYWIDVAFVFEIETDWAFWVRKADYATEHRQESMVVK